MIYVTYDADTGKITGCHDGDTTELQMSIIEVNEFRSDWTCTHYVDDGELRAYPAAAIAERDRGYAMQDMRARRDFLLQATVDTMSPIRWASLDGAKQAEWVGYRQALLDFPDLCSDPFNPRFPSAPQ